MYYSVLLCITRGWRRKALRVRAGSHSLVSYVITSSLRGVGATRLMSKEEYFDRETARQQGIHRAAPRIHTQAPAGGGKGGDRFGGDTNWEKEKEE